MIVITRQLLENQRNRLLRRGMRLPKPDWKYLNLTIRVLKENLWEQVQSLQVVQQLDLILSKISRIVIPNVIYRGRQVFQTMLNDPNFLCFHSTIRGWSSNPQYCLTAGLKDLKVLT